nr:hypothetical protein CFP56_50407 [Quercus suber]
MSLRPSAISTAYAKNPFPTLAQLSSEDSLLLVASQSPRQILPSEHSSLARKPRDQKVQQAAAAPKTC